MARRDRMCVVEGCERRAQMGQMVCKDHERSAIGVEMTREVVKLEREMRALVKAEDAEARRGAAERFRKRIERGDFAALFAGRFHELLQEKGNDEGLTNEIGALRLAVLRLMLEEDDPVKMGTALSKVTNATVRALNAQKELVPRPDPLSEAINRAWEVYEAEHAQKEEAAAAKRTNGQVAKEWLAAQEANQELDDSLEYGEEELPPEQDLSKLEGKALEAEMERLAWEEKPWVRDERIARAARKEMGRG